MDSKGLGAGRFGLASLGTGVPQSGHAFFRAWNMKAMSLSSAWSQVLHWPGQRSLGRSKPTLSPWCPFHSAPWNRFRSNQQTGGLCWGNRGGGATVSPPLGLLVAPFRSPPHHHSPCYPDTGRGFTFARTATAVCGSARGRGMRLLPEGTPEDIFEPERERGAQAMSFAAGLGQA